MFNPKVSGIAGGIGFVLSFLISIISGAGIGVVLIRAFAFAVGFFILITIVYAAINMYLPDLLDTTDFQDGLGANVDISVGEDDESADVGGGIAEDGFNDFLENSGETGENMDPFTDNTLDQYGEDGYTKKGDSEESTGPARPALPKDGGSVEDVDSVDVLPDLDFMSGAFTSSDEEAISAGNAVSAGASENASGGGNASGGSGKKSMGDDFNVQEMASAIQTILKREDKG